MSDETAEATEDLSSLNLEATASEWESVLESSPNDVQALVELSLCYGRMHRSDEAIRMARRAVELAPEYAPALCALGVELFLRDENDEAESELRRAIDLDPELAAAYFPLAQVLADQGDCDAGDEMLAKAREVAGEDPAQLAHGWYVEAYINLARGDLDEGERCIREALELEGANPRIAALAYANLGGIQTRRRKYDLAMENLAKAIQLNPYLCGAQWRLGQLYMFKKRYSEALTALQAASRDPRLAGPRPHYCLGLVYGKLGDSERSREHYQEALNLGLTGRYVLAARRALIWSRAGVRWLAYALAGCLAVWLAITRLPTPTFVFLAVLILLYAAYRWWTGRA